jgi:hypothetical protein
MHLLDERNQDIICVPFVHCKLTSDQCDIQARNTIEIFKDIDLSHVIKVVNTLVKCIKLSIPPINGENNGQQSFTLKCNIDTVNHGDSKISKIKLIHDKISQNTIINIDLIHMPFIRAKNAMISISKNTCTTLDNCEGDMETPFSKQAKFYEDGTKKPESAISIEQRDQFCAQTRSNALHYVSIHANKINSINIMGFVQTCKRVFATVNEHKDVFVSSPDIISPTNIISKKHPEGVFIEIESPDVNINIRNNVISAKKTHIMIGSQFWSVKSQKLFLSSMKKSPSPPSPPSPPSYTKAIDFGNVHVAGTLQLDHLVANAKKTTIYSLPILLNVFGPILFAKEKKPLDIKLNIHLDQIAFSDTFSPLEEHKHKIAIMGKNCEIITKTSENLTITLNRLSGKFDKDKWFDVNLVHVGIMKELIQLNVNSFHMWLFSNKIHPFVDYLREQVETLSKYIPKSEAIYDDDNPTTFTEGRGLNIIDNYDPSLQTRPDREIPEWNKLKFELGILHVNIDLLDETTDDSVTLETNRLQVLLYENLERIEIGVQTLEIIDKVKESLWNKALWTSDVRIVYVKSYISIDFDKEIHLHIDHHLLDFLQEYFETFTRTSEWFPVEESQIIHSTPTNTPTEEIESPLDALALGDQTTEQSKPPFNSIHISKMVFRFDYKPHTNNEDMFAFVNCVPIRGSKVVFNEFYLFQFKTWSSLLNELIINMLSNVQNIQGIVSGIKPLKPIANILSKGKNLLILPINNHI